MEALAALRPGVTAADVARRENDVFRACAWASTRPTAALRGHGLGLYVDSRLGARR
ncbi:MAG: hypothetical protein U1F49_15320 [Rubrivivax sp.]